MADSIAIIGEGMLEIRSQQTDFEQLNKAADASIFYGGDSINTSIYLSRQGIDAYYISALGDDYMSQWLLQLWQSEGVNTELVETIEGALPGMYVIRNDSTGERYFDYWRNNSAAKQYFQDAAALQGLYQRLKSFDYLYFSGISLAIFSDDARQELFGFLDNYRQQGGKVIFDGNYRPQLWASKEETQSNYQKMYGLTDIALPTVDDELSLYDETSADQVIKRIQDSGVKECALKMGEEGCWVMLDNKIEQIKANKVDIIDTTAAGDSFNAGYLSGRLNALNGYDSAIQGHQLASKVIQHKGAIIPR